jgi:hypothetical protein
MNKPRLPSIFHRLSRKPLPLIWYDGTLNFGDLIGPWMVQMLTGRQVVNIDRDKSAKGLLTVGSIITWMDRDGLSVWGSGLIRKVGPKTHEKLNRVRPGPIHAVRGKLTRQQLVKRLGWKVPKVYGDPALLLPRLYTPRQSSLTAGRVALLPHYLHKADLGHLQDDERVAMIDVQNDPDKVIDQIASAKAVLSSSLHGIICAQAFGVPWIWLQVPGIRLAGGEFKFHDFFTTLDADQVVAREVVLNEITPEWVLSEAQHASRPRDIMSLDPLMESFPLFQHRTLFHSFSPR